MSRSPARYRNAYVESPVRYIWKNMSRAPTSYRDTHIQTPSKVQGFTELWQGIGTCPKTKLQTQMSNQSVAALLSILQITEISVTPYVLAYT